MLTPLPKAYGNIRGAESSDYDSKRDDSEPNTSLRDDSTRDEEKTNLDAAADTQVMRERKAKYIPPYERWIVPVQQSSWLNPRKVWNWFKFLTLRGVFMDVITHDSARLHAIHARANRYDVRVEHMWTYCQVVSAMLMSIAHGSNDIANALGPVSAVYSTWQTGVVNTEADTPIWLIVIGGLMLGLGFWFMGEISDHGSISPLLRCHVTMFPRHMLTIVSPEIQAIM